MEFLGFDRDGKEIMIKYQVRYVGDKVGIFIPSKAALKSPKGGEFQNTKLKDKIFTFRKGEDRNVELVFESDSKKDNILLLKDVFSESVPEKLENVSFDLKINELKTVQKNR